MRQPIATNEMMEYGYAATSANYAERQLKEETPARAHVHIRDNIRAVLRLNRFNTINWLMANGVTIPAELIADQTHPEVGQQSVDKQT